MRFILYALLIWFLYNLVFKFIIPVYRTSSTLRKKFREMNDHMNQQRQDYQQQNAPTNSSSNRPKNESAAKKGDYIDFEEIK